LNKVQRKGTQKVRRRSEIGSFLRLKWLMAQSSPGHHFGAQSVRGTDEHRNRAKSVRGTSEASDQFPYGTSTVDPVVLRPSSARCASAASASLNLVPILTLILPASISSNIRADDARISSGDAQ